MNMGREATKAHVKDVPSLVVLHLRHLFGDFFWLQGLWERKGKRKKGISLSLFGRVRGGNVVFSKFSYYLIF